MEPKHSLHFVLDEKVAEIAIFPEAVPGPDGRVAQAAIAREGMQRDDGAVHPRLISGLEQRALVPIPFAGPV
jgi:hypothetical protein